MKSKRLNNFLYCFDLETGGLILGWFGIVGSIFAVLICTLMIVGLSDSYLTDENLQQMGFGDTESIDPERMDMIRTGLHEIIKRYANFKFNLVSSSHYSIKLWNYYFNFELHSLHLLNKRNKKCEKTMKGSMEIFIINNFSEMSSTA